MRYFPLADREIANHTRVRGPRRSAMDVPPAAGDTPPPPPPPDEEAPPRAPDVEKQPPGQRQTQRQWLQRYLRLSREEFFAALKDDHGESALSGATARLGDYMTGWQKRRQFIPYPRPSDVLYLGWFAHHVAKVTPAEAEYFVTGLHVVEPRTHMLGILDRLIAAWNHERAYEAYMATPATEGPGLEEEMQGVRDQQRSWICHIAAVKANQVDMLDETWRTADLETQRRVKARRKAFKTARRKAIDHPWLDDTDRKGHKRERYQKEMIVDVLIATGPQPWTREDLVRARASVRVCARVDKHAQQVWRAADKKQRYSDVYVTANTQSELIRGEWSGHPITPMMGAGEPARFGRRETDRRTDGRRAHVPKRHERALVIWPLEMAPVPAEMPENQPKPSEQPPETDNAAADEVEVEAE